MTTGNSLEIDAATDEAGTQSRPDSSESGIASNQPPRIVQPTGQFVQSNKLQIGSNLTLSNDSSFRTLYGRTRFGNVPGLPRSSAAIDLIFTLFCFLAVHYTYLGSLEFTTPRTIVLFGSIIFMVAALSVGGIYSVKRLQTLDSELSKLLVCWFGAFAAIGLFAFLSKTAGEVSRVWITLSFVFSLISLAAVRVLGCLWYLNGSKAGAKNVVICGNSASVKTVMRSLYDFMNSRVRVAKVFEFPAEQAGDALSSHALQNSAKQIVTFVENQRQSGSAIEQVWIAVPADQTQIVKKLSIALFDSSVDVCVVPDPYTDQLLNGEVYRFGETKIVNISEISLTPAADQFKRVFDVLLASVALCLLCIPMALIAVLIKSETRGPALFRQKRYGIDGREIEIFKFRSMLVHEDSQARQATKDDARVTRVGKILRSTSLDELPQLFNVLSGSMSLVGPRPHAVAHNEIWRNQIKGYMLRHKVRPGITGWAQVNGWRGETETAFKMQQRVKFDLEYIRNWSPFLDIKILFFTVVKGFRDENAY